MKKLIWSIITLICVLAYTNALASHQGRIGYTGGPQETNCTQCHTTYLLNTGPGTMTLTSDMPNWQYVPGQTYTLTLKVVQLGMPEFGMAIEANKDTGMIGTFSSMSPTDSVTIWRTRTITYNGTGGHVKYGMTHNRWNIAPLGSPAQYFYPGAVNDSMTWNVKWTAPLNNEGPLTFWFTGMAANFDETTSGDYTYTSSQVITPAPPSLTINCPGNQSMSSCQTQATINGAFTSWLAAVTTSGGCATPTITNDAGNAPDACGGSVTVTWTANDGCGTPVTCSATFTVDAAPALSLTCASNSTEAAFQTQSAIDAAYATWLNTATVTGGCNTVLSNNSTGAPPCTGGSKTVIWSATSDCGTLIGCSATFTVLYAPVITPTPDKLNGFSATLNGYSTPQTFVMTASNLTDDVKLMAPQQYQVSLTGVKGTWVRNLWVSKDVNGNINTTIYVRYHPTVAGTANGYVRMQTNGFIISRVRVTGNSTLRLNSDMLTGLFNISPNPAISNLNIVFGDAKENVTVTLFDLTGKAIQSVISAPATNLTLDVSNLTSGVYFVKFETGSEVQVKRFIKN